MAEPLDQVADVGLVAPLRFIHQREDAVGSGSSASTTALSGAIPVCRNSSSTFSMAWASSSII